MLGTYQLSFSHLLGEQCLDQGSQTQVAPRAKCGLTTLRPRAAVFETSLV